MAGKNGRKKRFWSDEEKISICAQTCVPGVSVAQVARRYALNANLIHKWLRDPKFASGPVTVDEQAIEAPCFLPVEVVELPVTDDPCPANETSSAQNAIEIEIAGGHRLTIKGSFCPDALAELIRKISA